MAVELQYVWFACPEFVDRPHAVRFAAEERVHHITNFGQSQDDRYSEDIVFVKIPSYIYIHLYIISLYVYVYTAT